MDINKLELLSDIAETKNLTLSADHMGYTQSAVSHAINKLEMEMGLSLLSRTNHGAELTKDGELLLPYIRSIVSHYKRLEEVIESVQGLQRGSVCIGTYSSMADRWLPAVIKKFQGLHPNIGITIREGGAQQLEDWLNSGKIDLGFMSRNAGQNFKFIPLARDPLCAIASAQLPLPPDYQVSFPIQAFSDYPFIASAPGVDMDVCVAFREACVEPFTSFHCENDHTIIPMVENNLGISLLPRMFLDGTEHSLRIMPLYPDFQRSLGIGIISEKDLSAPSREFINVAQHTIGDLLDS